MKKNILYVALAGMSLLLAGCNDDLGIDTPQAVEKHYGEEINFGGSASYNLAGKEGGSTRTVYGGYDKIADGKEPVYWVSTDQVRLFCNEAAVKTADYQVSDADGTKSQTGLTKTGAAGLQWGDPESKHTFYGVYPIPSDNSLTESTTLTGTIPAVQDYNTNEEIDSDGDGNYVFAPNMEYAHMVAKTVVNDPNNIGEQVFMKFTPIATAVEIELTNNAPTNDANDVIYNFREVHLSSDTHYLSGSFTANLDNMALGGAETDAAWYASGCPTGITYGNDKSKQVAVRLYDNGKAVSLAESKSLKFTVFMLPSSDGASNEDAVKDLKITLVTSEGNKTGTLNNIVIKKSKKTYMHTMPIGYEMTYNQAEWIKYVNDEKKLNALSIPGAGGASSGNVYSESSTIKDYLEQTLSIEDLWNVGVRCFEFTVDKHTTDNGDLGSVEVYCNAQETNMTLDECVTKVKTLLGEHPEEFAMVIITYQQQSGWNLRNADGTVDQTRKPNIFMSQLNTYWTNLKMPDGTQKALYSSDMTVETARGSLFCIARPTSQGEDNYAAVVTSASGSNYVLQSTTYSPLLWDTNVTVPENVLVIHGWGALKDKWYARGYTDCVYFRFGGNDHFDVLLNGHDNFLIGDVAAKDSATLVTMLGYRSDRKTKPGRPFESSSKESDFTTNINKVLTDEYAGVTKTADLKQLKCNFSYSVLTSKDNGVLQTNGAWVQEWARVSKTSKAYPSNSGYTYWLSSIDEKKAHITDCLAQSIDKLDTDKKIYINSLCGYYIIDGTNLSSTAQTNAKLSASGNSLTECNVANSLENTFRGDWKFNPLTGANNWAGMCGNIGDFASDINDFFLTELNSKLDVDKRLAGSTGIVLMDRVSNTTGAGAEIPSIIIANNFAPDQNATGASTYQIATSNLDLEGGDNIAAPARRNSQPSITWGEWE